MGPQAPPLRAGRPTLSVSPETRSGRAQRLDTSLLHELARVRRPCPASSTGAGLAAETPRCRSLGVRGRCQQVSWVGSPQQRRPLLRLREALSSWPSPGCDRCAQVQPGGAFLRLRGPALSRSAPTPTPLCQPCRGGAEAPACGQARCWPQCARIRLLCHVPLLPAAPTWGSSQAQETSWAAPGA